MAKPDWSELQDRFLSEHAESGVSPKEWCESQGLNYSSARRYIKKPTAQHSAQKNVQSDTRKLRKTGNAQKANDSDAQEIAQEFDLRSYGLNDMQMKFVDEYLIDLNRTAAYKRAGYKGEGNTAYVNASRLLRNAKVTAAVRDAMDARAKRTQISQDAVLQWWWDIATADASELTEYHRGCCRYCWGFGHQYQWRDIVEFEEEFAEAAARKQREPTDQGGYGYDAVLDPNPECPRCNGVGLSRTVIHDTRDTSAAARRLFAGVKEGKFGIEVITRNQDDALKMVAQHLGMLKSKTEISGPEGGPIQTEATNLTPDEAAELYRKMMG
ncbi:MULTISPECIES: terminase small subunit [unclassified Tatumella]|uniref:terminase small subunit n=1 Tax=unclassified Tatumella TaxID=2649542 RepID=UPI001BB00196|nr:MULTISPECIES: terminase small subunit [unclassified Tatumella]MBS0877977.1 terminase small subunit [Tatumella sp. JGM82]MBS0891300.1 terminase small subunit [Tatumella sp. JGM94]MBS0902679.1 terminase small subunit [Tatumella sp. JGM100]